MEMKRRLRSSEGKSAATASAGSEWFSAEELEAAREAYLEEQQQEQPAQTVKLRYALALVKSNKRDDKRRGMDLLEDLVSADYEMGECLYWLALTMYGLGDYRSSRSYCERLLRLDPTHPRGLALHQCIKEMRAAATAEGIVGLGLVGAVVVAGIALKMLLKR